MIKKKMKLSQKIRDFLSAYSILFIYIIILALLIGVYSYVIMGISRDREYNRYAEENRRPADIPEIAWLFRLNSIYELPEGHSKYSVNNTYKLPLYRSELSDEHGNSLYDRYYYTFYDKDVFRRYQYSEDGRIMMKAEFDIATEFDISMSSVPDDLFAYSNKDLYFYKYKDGRTAYIRYNDFDKVEESIVDENGRECFLSVNWYDWNIYEYYRLTVEDEDEIYILDDNGDICTYITKGENGETLQEVNIEKDGSAKEISYKWYEYEESSEGVILRGILEFYSSGRSIWGYKGTYTSYRDDGTVYCYDYETEYYADPDYMKRYNEPEEQVLEGYTGTFSINHEVITGIDKMGHEICLKFKSDDDTDITQVMIDGGSIL